MKLKPKSVVVVPAETGTAIQDTSLKRALRIWTCFRMKDLNIKVSPHFKRMSRPLYLFG